jgi:DNA-binding transcriptional ArsR family regulator
MQDDSFAEIFAALGNKRRLQIVQWLSDPVAHFPPQRDGDLLADGVCAGAIVTKLGVSQPSVAAHMKILTSTGIVSTKRIKQWTFHQLDTDALEKAQALIGKIADAGKR